MSSVNACVGFNPIDHLRKVRPLVYFYESSVCCLGTTFKTCKFVELTAVFLFLWCVLNFFV